MKKQVVFMALLAVTLSACSSLPSGSSVATPVMMTAQVSTVIANVGGTVPPFATPEPPTAIPTLASGISPTELKYRVLEQFPDFFFCDPDYYPIARAEESDLARQHFPEIQANAEEFQAILAHTGLGGLSSFNDEQQLLIYREYKKLNAIHFELAGDQYQFQIQTGAEGQQGSVVTATIDSRGKISVLKKEPSFPTCPICLAAGTRIETPRGAVRVEDLRPGDPVWTMDESGVRIAAVILQTGNVRVPATHRMIHVILEDGRELWASAGHPTADGRSLGSLRVGDLLDGARIIQLERVPYLAGFTFDILPSGDTGLYWANGILMGSTLHP